MSSKYRILGVEDNHICELCGKSDLKVRVVLEHIESGEIIRVGTTCASKLTANRNQDAKHFSVRANIIQRAIAAYVKGFAKGKVFGGFQAVNEEFSGDGIGFTKGADRIVWDNVELTFAYLNKIARSA